MKSKVKGDQHFVVYKESVWDEEAQQFYEVLRRVPVSPQVYSEYYRPVWRQQKSAQKDGQCMCARMDLWKCDGDCAACDSHAAGNLLSLNASVEGCEDNDIEIGDTVADPESDFSDSLLDRLVLDEYLAELGKRDVRIRRICELMLEGHSEREAAGILHMARSTFKRRLASIRDELSKRLYG